MEINVNVRISPSEELSALITALVGGMNSAEPKQGKAKKAAPAKELPPVVNADTETGESQDNIFARKLAETEEAKVAEEKQAATTNAPTVSLETIKVLAVDKTKNGKQKEVSKLILETFGLKALSDLASPEHEDKKADFYTQLQAI